MEFYLKVDLERISGPPQAADAVRGALEDELRETYFAAQDSRHRVDSGYTITVTGIETSIAGLMASIKARAVQDAMERRADREEVESTDMKDTAQ